MANFSTMHRLDEQAETSSDLPQLLKLASG
jgi:hypothetical protein